MLSSLFAAAATNDTLNSAGVVAAISAISALGVAYITNVVAKRRREAKHPDRMATIFDGYEKLIAQQQEEITRKSTTITALEEATDRLEKQLEDTRKLLQRARDELQESKEHNTSLKNQLDNMRKEYKKDGTDSKTGR